MLQAKLVDLGISLTVNLTGSNDPVVYEVQWNESSLEFIKRIAEEQAFSSSFEMMDSAHLGREWIVLYPDRRCHTSDRSPIRGVIPRPCQSLAGWARRNQPGDGARLELCYEAAGPGAEHRG